MLVLREPLRTRPENVVTCKYHSRLFVTDKSVNIYFNLTELIKILMRLKARMLAFVVLRGGGHGRTRGKTTDLGPATTTLPHAYTRVRIRAVAVTSKSFPASLSNNIKSDRSVLT